MEPILVAEEIYKSFYDPEPTPVLKGVNLIAHRGESIAIMGRSGEGKSTLLHTLGTLESPSKGSVIISGNRVSSFNRSKIRNQSIGFIFQSFHLLNDLTVLENVMMPAKIGRKSQGVMERAEKLIDSVGLSDRKAFLAKLLSGGEKQRAAFARALCNDPDIIMADEPTGNLDKKSADAIHKILISYAKEMNKCLIIVTHDPVLAALCDRTLVLQDGLLV